MRIYFVGSHATGKTTMARYVSRTYGLPMITEVARAVLAEMEMSIDTIRADIGLVNEYQTRIFQRQVEVEHAKQGGFVSDRAFDNLAYAAEHACVVADLLDSETFRDYMHWVGKGVVFFLRPHPALVRADGIRAGLDWESVVRIDGMVKLLLEQFRMRYLPIDSLNMQERVRAVEYVLGGPQVGAARSASSFASRPRHQRTSGEKSDAKPSPTNTATCSAWLVTT